MATLLFVVVAVVAAELLFVVVAGVVVSLCGATSVEAFDSFCVVVADDVVFEVAAVEFVVVAFCSDELLATASAASYDSFCVGSEVAVPET